MPENSPHFAAYYRWLILSQYLNVHVRAGSVLDVGCGEGFFLRRQGGRLKIGVDLAPRARPGEGMLIVQADGVDLPFADRSFHTVFAFDVIEHVVEDRAFVESLVRVLKPGGHLWLSTPVAKSYFLSGRLTRWAMEGWGHQRVGYVLHDLLRLFPSGCHIQVVFWGAPVFRLLYLALWAVSRLSPSLARLGARFCFGLDRLLSRGRDHIFLKVTREEETG